MKRTDAQRAFFQGLPVRTKGMGWETKWQRLGQDGMCRDVDACPVARPLIFELSDAYNTGWEIAVGEGYRLLDPTADKPREGDEFWYHLDRKWVKWVPVTITPCCARFYRRKVEAETETEPDPEPEWEYDEWQCAGQSFYQTQPRGTSMTCTELMSPGCKHDGWELVGFVFKWRGKLEVLASPIAYGNACGKANVMALIYHEGNEVLRPTAALMRRKRG